jgi:hypothetical protein
VSQRILSQRQGMFRFRSAERANREPAAGVSLQAFDVSSGSEARVLFHLPSCAVCRFDRLPDMELIETKLLFEERADVFQGILGRLERKIGGKHVRHAFPDVQLCISSRCVNLACEPSRIIEKDFVFSHVEQNRWQSKEFAIEGRGSWIVTICIAKIVPSGLLQCLAPKQWI